MQGWNVRYYRKRKYGGGRRVGGYQRSGGQILSKRRKGPGGTTIFTSALGGGGITRSFVPRARGPFSVTEMKQFESFLEDKAIPEAAAMGGKEADPATLNTIFAPTTGSNFNNREGRKCTVFRIKINAVLEQDAEDSETTTNNGSMIRMVLYMDKQTNATFAQSENVFSTIGTPSVKNSINAMQNPANYGRFRVLLDRTFSAPITTSVNNNGAGTVTTDAPQRQIKLRYNFRNGLKVHFNSTNGGTVADIIDNSLHVLCWRVGGMSCKLDYHARVSFKDF